MFDLRRESEAKVLADSLCGNGKGSTGFAGVPAMTLPCGSANKAKSPTVATGRAFAFLHGGSAMSAENHSPISVEILAQCGRKFRVRLRLAVPVGFVLVLISTVIKLLG